MNSIQKSPEKLSEGDIILLGKDAVRILNIQRNPDGTFFAEVMLHYPKVARTIEFTKDQLVTVVTTAEVAEAQNAERRHILNQTQFQIDCKDGKIVHRYLIPGSNTATNTWILKLLLKQMKRHQETLVDTIITDNQVSGVVALLPKHQDYPEYGDGTPSMKWLRVQRQTLHQKDIEVAKTILEYFHPNVEFSEMDGCTYVSIQTTQTDPVIIAAEKEFLREGCESMLFAIDIHESPHGLHQGFLIPHPKESEIIQKTFENTCKLCGPIPGF